MKEKLKNDFEQPIVTHKRISFGHCDVIFRYKEILSFFGHCHVTIQYMGPLSFFGRFVQKLKVSCFSDSFVQKTLPQSDGSCNATSDSHLLHKLFEKQPL